MIEPLRRLRGVAGIGVAWAIAWAAFFVALILVVGVVRPGVIGPGEGPLEVGGFMGFVGLLAGLGFGVALALAESGKPVARIPLPRVALWGVLGSALVPLVSGRQDQVFVLCPLGAVVAMTLVEIARRASRRDTGRPPGAVSRIVLASVRDAVTPPRPLPTKH